MNFLSAFGDLPRIQTRKALLLLDFQNDFVRSTGALHVSNTTEVLEILPQLVSAFRRSGDVVWVRSYSESPQPLVTADGQDVVVLSRAQEPALNEEAFLSIEPPNCCLPQTPGAQFPAPLLAAIDTDSDILIEKSEYSALHSPRLVLSLRTRFVTELYLCGSLSNASVHATALDAVRHGFSITLVEDCLGYRSFPRHEEAMRRMADILGASGITSQELLEELDRQETDQIASSEPRPARATRPAGIEGDLEELDVRLRNTSKAESPEPSPRRRRIDDILAEMSDDENGYLKELAELTRERARFRQTPQAGQSQPSRSGDNVARTKMRRKLPEKKDEPISSQADSRRARKAKSAPNICRPGDTIGEGDSRIVYDLDLPANTFESIRDEVAWQKMYHMSGQVPRLVAVQGKHSPDGSIPIYRHPADESPPLQLFTPSVDGVRVIVERILGHPLNHVLIQLYRDGKDRISEHSDKTLDIVRGSSICNVSLGAQRVMILRAKGSEKEEGSGRLTQRVPMPHESLFVLGETTNARWLHGVKADKRQETEKSAEERAYGGQRISLTFRHIGTFLDPTGNTIWGQGAVSKSLKEAHPVIHGDPEETERLVRAFGEENRSIDFDWDAIYGKGFDVVNFVTPTAAKLVPAEDEVANLRVHIGLSENGIRYDTTPLGAVHSSDVAKLPLYIDADGTQIAGDTEILRYLAQRTPESERPGMEMLRGGDKLADVNAFLERWHQHRENDDDFSTLQSWDAALGGLNYLGGSALGIDDCAFWPVLRDIVQKSGPLLDKTYPNLYQYYNRVGKRSIVKTILEELK
ncbi:isochorismatase family protein family [Aspergillus lucknowensis]|uniref:Fe2OG dioxygenase domain-containing protein n=1 Tax=Aspergillus lucknowensis TaxID=176173 RepID=A0ABR4LS26_9EURO